MPHLLILNVTSPAMNTRLEAAFETITRFREIEDQEGWLETHGADVDYVLTSGGRGLTGSFFDKLPNLRAASSYGVGYDALEADAAVGRGIPVGHTPHVLSQEVATTALMLMLTCLRNFRAEEANARSGRWATDGNLPLSRTADRRTIGILGMGRIGKVLAAKLRPFEPTLLYTDVKPQDVPYEFIPDRVELARRSEILFCVVPGGAATRHLVDAAVMGALGPQGLLINVGRGSSVDEQSLIAALEAGKLGGAGLDVFENEPHIPEALRAMENVVVLPHVASATVETRAAMGDLAVDNLLQHVAEGTMPAVIPECAHLI